MVLRSSLMGPITQCGNMLGPLLSLPPLWKGFSCPRLQLHAVGESGPWREDCSRCLGKAQPHHPVKHLQVPETTKSWWLPCSSDTCNFISWRVWMQEGKPLMLNWGPKWSQAGHKGNTEIPLTYFYHWSFPRSQWRVHKPFVQIKPFLLNKSWAQNSYIFLGKTRLNLDFCDTGVFSGWTSAELSGLSKQFASSDEFNTCP